MKVSSIMKKMREILEKVFSLLYSRFGPQHWWPGDGELEIIVGAVLTQNTSWRNVERAIWNLKEAGLLDLDSLHKISVEELAKLIRPSGFYRIKAARLKELIKVLVDSGGIERFKRMGIQELRGRLLEIDGVGPETADSIALYAFGKPIFVVDAYTRRIFSRLGIFEGSDLSYQEVQRLFMENLDHDVMKFNEYHALLVRLGKTHCTKRDPDCPGCPLKAICSFFKERALCD